ncbi:MAG TPA: sulfatase-like hydrolase/transferase, partial [Vicinamibacterales bacterium]
PALGVILLLAVPFAVYAAVGRVSMFDWDFMFQKLIAIAAGIVSFACLHALLPNRTEGSRGPGTMTFAAVVGLVLCGGTTIGTSAWLRASEASAQISTYIAADPSLRLARDLVVRRDESSAGFYAFLRANTGIAGPVAPVEINVVATLSPVAPAPHVFLFVVDSLRPDYLSAYNKGVTFTPAFDAFARDSVVFDRAFSRYGGTGLSVPSIWAAGMIPHKEYVTPFTPMNVLAKLLHAYDYRRFITADHITDALFPRSADTVDLDRTVPEMRHTLCGTLTELESKLQETPRSSRPIFGHTRPLDLHIGNVWSARPDPGESYPGFHAAYASRVHRMDTCFGRFIEFLRHDGLYDDSIIIVTADHGDSLGEGLRWGHGFTVFPEVMRIPLVIHIPRRMSDKFTADVHRVSFTVDVTPTLYALLGQQPVTHEPMEGSSLFVRSPGELTDRRSASFLVASSYGPSYGVLSDNGSRLYIADGINGREYAFDLTASLAGRPLGLTDDQRAAARRVVQEQIDAIASTYHVPQKTAPGQ